MVRAWLMVDVNPTNNDVRLEHQLDPPKPFSLDKLLQLGVEYFKLDPVNFEAEGKLADLRKERSFSYQDHICISKESLGDQFEPKTKMFFEEHLHCDDEIRFFLEGGGYFDVRDDTDNWVRIECRPGDLLILPAGIYHRFTLDTNDYAKVHRYFVGVPVWTPFPRPADDHPARKAYLEKYGK